MSPLIWTVIAGFLGFIIDSWDQIAAYVLVLSPDQFDPYVAKLLAFIVGVLVLFVGPSRTPKKDVDPNF